jgi:hypothetical protein
MSDLRFAAFNPRLPIIPPLFLDFRIMQQRSAISFVANDPPALSLVDRKGTLASVLKFNVFAFHSPWRIHCGSEFFR